MINVESPKDIEGREIPLDILVLYDKDGSELNVKRIEFDAINKKWNFAVQKGSSDRILIYRRPQEIYLEKPTLLDDWEKLEEDLVRAIEDSDTFSSMACAYINQSGDTCCCCKFYDSHERSCSKQMIKDIVIRIRKLRGEN